MKRILVLAMLLTGWLAAPALASPDAGLYDPLPPEGSAFVRFINVSGEKGSKPAATNGKNREYPKHGEVTPYFVAAKGKTKISVGDAAQDHELEAGKFYTVIWTGGNNLRIVEDPANDNRAKAQILLYNVGSADPVALKTKDGKTEVIAATGQDAPGARQINPVKVELGLFNGDKKLGDVPAGSLERGMSYSVVYVNGNEAPIWARSITNTTR